MNNTDVCTYVCTSQYLVLLYFLTKSSSWRRNGERFSDLKWAGNRFAAVWGDHGFHLSKILEFLEMLFFFLRIRNPVSFEGSWLDGLIYSTSKKISFVCKRDLLNLNKQVLFIKKFAIVCVKWKPHFKTFSYSNALSDAIWNKIRSSTPKCDSWNILSSNVYACVDVYVCVLVTLKATHPRTKNSLSLNSIMGTFKQVRWHLVGI